MVPRHYEIHITPDLEKFTLSGFETVEIEVLKPVRELILNALEMEVEQAAVELLALQQPMARDLRFVIGAIKVSNDLERVGDHAVNIAESALRLAGKPKVSIRVPEIEVMARRARKM